MQKRPTYAELEKQLNALQIKYDTLFHKTAIPLCFVNKETSSLKFNKQFEQTFGWTAADIPTLEHWWLLAYPDPEYRAWVKNKCFTEIKRAIDTHTDIKPIEYKVTCKSGDMLTMVVYGSYIKKDLLLSFFNINERKRMEVELTIQAQKYRTLVESIPDFIVRYDLDMRRTYVNPAWEKASGLSAEEVIGVDHTDIPKVPVPVVDAYAQAIREVIDTGRSKTMEFAWINANGAKLFLDYVINPEFDHQGKIIGVLAVGRDITERKEAAKKLLDSEKRFSTIFDTNPAANTLSRLDNSQFIDVNQAWQELTGYSRSEAIGHTPEELNLWVVPDQQERIFKILQKQEPAHSEVRIRHKSGEIVDVVFSASLIELSGEKYILAMGQDITAQRKMEMQIQQAQKMESIGILAGGIAHDFNNILSSIIGFTELALEDVKQNTMVEDNLQEVYRAGQRAKALVAQIIAFARQSERELKPTRVDIIIKEVLQFIRSSLPATIKIQSHNIHSKSFIMGNPTQVHQIIMNLFTNAAFAMEENGGVLTVSLKDAVIKNRFDEGDIGLKDGDYIELSVSDTGTGIPPEIIDSIFDPYFTTKDPGEGTGMGLAMVHGIIENYGGKITVESSYGKGATFSVYMPITRKPKAHRRYKDERLPTGTEKILFVDDEAPIVKMGALLLEGFGYSVTSCTSSLEALKLFRTEPNLFDLVITDMTMPNMTGDKLSAEMMKIRQDIPIILYTGYSKKISKKAASEIGIKAFAYKPVIKSELAKTVRKVLDEAKSLNDE